MTLPLPSPPYTLAELRLLPAGGPAGQPAELRVAGGPAFAATLRLDSACLRETADPDAYGLALGAMIFAPDGLGGPFAQCLAAGGQRVRVRLRVDPPELQDLAWERLHYPLAGAWAPLALGGATPLARAVDAPSWRRHEPAGPGGLRALVVIAAPADLGRWGLDPIGDEERRAARELFAAAPGVRVTVLESGTAAPPTRAALAAALAEGPDLLHVLCHGAAIGAGAVLYLEGDGGATQPVPAAWLEERLGGAARPPALVFLAACETAARADARANLPLGPALVARGGAAAAVAMTGQVGIATARALTEAFYRRLLAHGLADLALNEARETVRERWDWAVPALFSRVETCQILAPARATTTTMARDPLPLMPRLTPELAQALGDALLVCGCVSNPNDRETLLGQLPRGIAGAIRRSPSDRIHVHNIVATCARFSGGLAALAAAVRRFEGDSEPVEQIDRLLRQAAPGP